MKIIKHILTLSVVISFFACKKEDVEITDTTVGHSRITFFAELNMSGNEIMSVVKGSTFADPGVTATESGKTIPVTVTGTVNTNTVGLYELTYSAVNSDGFPASVSRSVFVIPEAEKPGVDLSGEYKAIGGAPSNAMVSKVAPGVYYTTNCWGGGSLAVIPAYFICSDGATVNLPLQTGVAGRIQSEGNGTYVNGLISWTITRLDFASGPLTVAKQWQKL